ncbi:MAG TPA: deaminase [Bacillota bacterium]|nr:deaminase [Bacillota bacterium]HPT60992.1 deaminase [Bacillota bacterium]
MWESILEDRRVIVDRIMMKLALTVANLSNCRKKQTGAVIAGEGVIAFGFNHTRRKCLVCYREDAKSGLWTDKERCDVVHAEIAAIFNAYRMGLSLKNGCMYSTYFPCVPCARAIGEADIKRLYYIDEYEEQEPAIRVLNSYGISIHKMRREDL